MPFLDQPGAAPRTRQDAAVWLLLAVAGFVVGEIAALLFTVVAAAVVGKTGSLQAIATLAVPPEWYVASSLLGLWVGFFGAPWLASRARGTRDLVADLGLRFRPVDLLGVLIGIGGQILVGLMYAPFIHHLRNFNAPTQKLTGGAHGWGYVVIAVFTVVGAPFFEELFFRGLVLRGLVRFLTPAAPGRSSARSVGVVAAVVVTGALFGLAHGELVQFAGLATFGVVLSAIAYRTGRLGMNMCAHATFNLVAVVSIFSSRGGVLH